MDCKDSSPQAVLQRKWTKIATIFLYITVIWNMIEGASSVYFGYMSDDISLFSFGVDSLIEVLSASLLLYHMLCSKKSSSALAQTQPINSQSNKSMIFSLETERKLTLFIGCLLVLFCLFACVGGIFRLVQRIPPQNTVFGIVIGGVCIVAMFVLWLFKMKASVVLNSSALASDAACSLGCVKLSTVLCLGSIVYEVWHSLWWVDAATAILIGLMVGYEGCETIKNAKDRESFQGGCGCCSGSDNGLAKYVRTKMQKQMQLDHLAAIYNTNYGATTTTTTTTKVTKEDVGGGCQKGCCE